jgi:hypothetical protein
MTTISNLGALPNLKSTAPLRQSKLWNQDVESVKPTQVLAFFKRMQMQGRETEARDNIDTLLFTINEYAARSDIDGCLISNMKLPTKTYSIDDLLETLTPMNDVRRSAVLFALSAKIKLTDVMSLRWKDVAKLDMDKTGKRILFSQPRHIKTDLVFWEYTEGRLSPLLSLVEHVELLAGLSWTWLEDVYDQVEPFNFNNDYWMMRRSFWKSFIN